MSAWTLSKKTGQSPSSLFGLAGIEAYFVDEVVVYWGISFDEALQAAVAKAKDERGRERAAQRVVRKWIPSQRTYADPRNR